MSNPAGYNNFWYALGFTREPTPEQLTNGLQKLEETGKLRTSYFAGLAAYAGLNGIPADLRATCDDALAAFRAKLPADVIKPKKEAQLTVVGLHD